MASGSIRWRYSGRDGRPDSYSIILELGYETDPVSDIRRRRQQFSTFHGTEKEAQDKLRKMLSALDDGTFVEPSKVNFIDYLRSWLVKSVAPTCRPNSLRVYRNIVENHIAKSNLALRRLQSIRGSDLTQYLAGVTPGSVDIHRAALGSAFREAMLDRLVSANPTSKGHLRLPRAEFDPTADATEHCWSLEEMQLFLKAADTASVQTAAFMRLALDSGCRKSELYGLRWPYLDLDKGTLRIEWQLDRAGEPPVFGPPKSKKSRRTISLDTATLDALRVHKIAQAELRLKNGHNYHNFNLVFAREPEHLQTPTAALGQAIRSLNGTPFERLIAQAGVRKIKFHGCRHSVATALLDAGVPPKDVAFRMGHSIDMLSRIYTHSMPTSQADAAARLGALLRSTVGQRMTRNEA